MLMFDIPFGTTEWDGVERTEHPGETGKAFWRTRNFNNIRVRMVTGDDASPHAVSKIAEKKPAAAAPAPAANAAAPAAPAAN